MHVKEKELFLIDRYLCQSFTAKYLESLKPDVFQVIEFISARDYSLAEKCRENLSSIYINQINYISLLKKNYGDAEIVRLGDVHKKGRCTVKIEGNGERFIYKPVSSDLLITLNNILELINRSGYFDFYLLQVLESSEHHSVMEFVDNENIFDIKKYSYHYGALLLIVTLLKGIDFHYENVFSIGSTPVIIDCESLFYPTLKNTVPYNVSATSMIPTQRNNLSVMSKNSLCYKEIINGIEDASSVVGAIKKQLIDVVSDSIDKPRRIIFKPTRYYYELLSKSLHPAFLVDKDKRKHFLETCLMGKHPISMCAIENEVRDLMRLDIPYFSCSSDYLYGSDGEKIEQEFFDDTALNDLVINLERLNLFKCNIIKEVVLDE